MELHVTTGELEIILGFAGFIFGLFVVCEKSVKEEIKVIVGNYLSKIGSEEKSNLWPDVFLSFFEKLFGSNPWTWKRFVRSTIASMLISSTLPVFLLLIVLIFDYSNNPNYTYNFNNFKYILVLCICYLVSAVLINGCIDWISLNQTEWLLKVLQTRTQKIWIFLVDFILTSLCAALIILLCYTGLYFLEILFYKNSYYLLEDSSLILEILTFLHRVFDFDAIGPSKNGGLTFDFWSGFENMWNKWHPSELLLPRELLLFSPLIISTYFTSIWMYIFIVSSVTIRLRLIIRKGTNKVFGLFDIQKYPFSALAVSGSLLTVVFGLILALLLNGK